MDVKKHFESLKLSIPKLPQRVILIFAVALCRTVTDQEEKQKNEEIIILLSQIRLFLIRPSLARSP